MTDGPSNIKPLSPYKILISPGISMPEVKETSDAKRLRKKTGLDNVHGDIKRARIRYIDHQLGRSIATRCETMFRIDPAKQGTRDAKTTRARGGGDCDDLAAFYAYVLKQRSRDPKIEYGVMYGWAEKGNGLYTGHALLTIRDKRYPNRYHFYEVTDLSRRPKYVGAFVRSSSHNRYPTPRGNKKFILNVYVPIKSDGTLEFSSKIYFVPPTNPIKGCRITN